MKTQTKLSVRSVSPLTQERLRQLKAYTRLPYGALLDDSVEALWEAYVDDGHDVARAEPSR